MTKPLPEEFLQSLSSLKNFNQESFVAVHETAEQLVSVHMNPGKPIFQNGNWLAGDFDHPFVITKKVPWASDAYYLSERPSFTLDPLFHAGSYYVQEASGMFLAYALNNLYNGTEKIRVLDLCASPGGKSTILQSLLSADSLLVSNEVINSRIAPLVQNMSKWGYSNGIVSSNDPAIFKKLTGFFDILVIDAPCSGSGLFRKDPEAIEEWSIDSVQMCSRRQQRILADSWDTLKAGGYLIYCTCSYSSEENEDSMDFLLSNFDAESLPLFPPTEWNIQETQSPQCGAVGYRFYPDRLSGEGFFLSVVRKKEDTVEYPVPKSSKNLIRLNNSAACNLAEWINTENSLQVSVGDAIHMLPGPLGGEWEVLRNNLYLKKAGLRLGKAGETDWIPDHEMALAINLKKNIPTVDLSKTEALQYLRGLPFETGSSKKGWKLVRYQQQPLGWAKILDRRVNNYYPKSWRIRQH